jgi:uncharacterized protein (TIGR02391 family)
MTFNQPSESDDWSFTFDRRVRKFRDVCTIAEYWDLAHEAYGAQPSFRAPEMEHAPPPSGASDPSWSTLLHPGISQLAHPRLVVGHDDNAVEEAWKVVAQRIRDLTGSELDGTQLINEVLGNRPLLRFGPEDTEQGRSAHNGMTSLLRGLAQFGRNVRAHRPSSNEPSETETAALLLLASVCMQHLEQLEPRGEHIEEVGHA